MRRKPGRGSVCIVSIGCGFGEELDGWAMESLWFAAHSSDSSSYPIDSRSEDSAFLGIEDMRSHALKLVGLRFFDPPPRSTPATRRSFRVIVVLAGVFVLTIFDLAYTQAQLPRGNFLEANLLAAGAVEAGAMSAAAYKVLLFGAGAYILHRFRRTAAAELGTWLLAACHVGLMVWWELYFQALEVCCTGAIVYDDIAAY